MRTLVCDTYYVQKLHPTLSLLKWDYGALTPDEEREYVRAKLKMLQKDNKDDPLEEVDREVLAELIVQSQKLMRDFLYEQLINSNVSPEEAKIRSSCCVSQRDIQRVIKFYVWLLQVYKDKDNNICEDTSEQHRCALLVSLGLIYYMRLPGDLRTRYVEYLDHPSRNLGSGGLTFKTALQMHLDFYTKNDNLEIPSGIAKTEALKENILATILCCVTRTPLIIEGAPGTSKTLSFNITVANLKGRGSRKKIFQNDNIYPSLEPQFYQCSKRTNSEEVNVVFRRAIKVQGHRTGKTPSNSVVFMDEAGLPEKAHESLKVLHYYLEHPEVSFVAITNHPLDAAKTNRAVSVYRPQTSTTSEDDLHVLTRDCLGIENDDVKNNINGVGSKIDLLCSSYQSLMKSLEFSKFFGLRDFIYFLLYLRNKLSSKGLDFTLEEKVTILHSLERNFGGSEDFDAVCNFFKVQVSKVMAD